MTHPTTEARLRRIAAERAHNRRTQGVTDGGPHLRAGRRLATFPGFPRLRSSAPLRPGESPSQAQAAIMRDAVNAAVEDGGVWL